ncbi:unnamed protein product, partial [Rotaria magnacalcarata]
MDNKGSLYISDYVKHQLTKWPDGQVVAGGNQEGSAINQLSEPVHIFVDQDYSVFVADFRNDLIVDKLGNVYIVDSDNHRVVRWLKGSKSGSVIIGGRDSGSGIDQLSGPTDMAFDRQGNL